MAALISARGLTRRFVSGSGQVVTALDALDLDLPAGAFIVVRGPSGCGKSTLLNLIGMLDRPSEGGLTVGGVDLAQLDATGAARFRRETVGFLFQDAGLIEPMTVADNVALPLAYREVPRRERADRVRAVLARVGLEDRRGSQVGELSGGERQRVGLARALSADPPLLICDEPTAALDEANSRAIAGLLSARAAEGGTVICSSHDPIIIARADRRVSLLRGHLDAEADA